MKKKLKIIILLVSIVGATSCDLNQQTNPSLLSASQANNDYLLNTIQTSLPAMFQDLSQYGMEVTRILPPIGGNTYSNMYQPTAFDNIWINAYAGIFENTKLLLANATPKKLYFHTGMAKVIQAYAMVALVDYFGDIPYTQALDPTNFSPKTDPSSSIYAAALAMLDDAISDLGKTPSAYPSQDLYYGTGVGKVTSSNATKWITCAKTIKLKIYLNQSLVDKAGSTTAINALIAGNDLIDNINGTEDFAFFYPATSFSNPDNYHPWFKPNYHNGAAQYMGNYYMSVMLNAGDPRTKYYFYRQTVSAITDVNVLSCAGLAAPAWFPAGMAFCQLGNGYFGRDFGDNSGINPDTKLRTVFGQYPIGGSIDNGKAAALSVTSGLKGQGIFPILMASYTSFMLAEAALRLGTTGSPRALLLDGVTKSCIRVINAPYNPTVALAGSQLTPPTAVNNYVNQVGTNFDAATDQLNVVATEYWVALFGSGYEAYNMYRRIGKPTGLQPARYTANPGNYYRTFYYPAEYAVRNSNAKQKTDGSVQVFWDNNPADPNWIN